LAKFNNQRNCDLPHTRRDVIRQTCDCFFLILCFALATIVSPSQAKQKDPRLKGLFERLNGSDVKAETYQITSEIWSTWIESGDGISNELIRLGILAMQAQRLNIALNHFNQLVKHELRFAEGWNKRTTVLYDMGRIHASIDDIQKVLVLKLRHFDALAGLGMYYEVLGNVVAAAKAYALALAANRHRSRIHKRLQNLWEQIRRNKILKAT
jgi:tetratricopeptide (TPR) repeat protein